MGDKLLAESSAKQRVLSSQLANLTIPPVKGETTSPVAEIVSGNTYHMKLGEVTNTNNQKDIQAVTLYFHEKNCLLVIADAEKEHQIRCAYNQWLRGTTKFYDQPSAKVEASGAWSDSNTFTLTIFSIETPHSLTMTFRFDGEALTLKRRWNVSFGPLELPVLTGNK
jgi:hypothetical protein